MVESVVAIRGQDDIVAARQAGREMAGGLGFSRADQTRLATAISELTRNVTQHTDEGTCTIICNREKGTTSIRVVVEDHGPGIADIEQAMQDGFSTSKGLGAGLPGTKRLMHEFNIESQPGYTKITIGMRRESHD